jgi:hypothetical protein
VLLAGSKSPLAIATALPSAVLLAGIKSRLAIAGPKTPNPLDRVDAGRGSGWNVDEQPRRRLTRAC